MAALELTESRPVVLVVEDHEEALQMRAEMLAAAECTPIGVQSDSDAIRELRASPGVDLVLTDIHLGRGHDRSGIHLARRIREEYRGLPIIGYSAHFADPESIGDDIRVFDDTCVRGAMGFEDIQRTVADCRRRAMDHRRSRLETAFKLLKVLRRKHENAQPELELMRSLAIGAGPAAQIERELGEAGYELQLVETDVTGFARPVIVWLLQVESFYEAEIYGHPALYAVGSTAAEAIQRLVDLMALYAAELRSREQDLGIPARDLKDFLDSVV